MVGNSRTVGVALSFRVPSEAHGLPVYGGRRKGRKVARADRFSEGRAFDRAAPELLEQVGVEADVVES